MRSWLRPDELQRRRCGAVVNRLFYPDFGPCLGGRIFVMFRRRIFVLLRNRIFVLLRNCAALGLVLFLTPQPSLVAAGDAEGFSMDLFNGRDLEGWVVTGCKAGVEDGLLVLQEGDGLVRSEHDYGDFVLELEWRARKAAAWDSGVYFRAEPPAAGKPWPSRYQANLEQGKEGNVKGLAGAESSGLAKAGQWNQLRLKVVGSQAEMTINGQLAWKVDGVKPDRGY